MKEEYDFSGGLRFDPDLMYKVMGTGRPVAVCGAHFTYVYSPDCTLTMVCRDGRQLKRDVSDILFQSSCGGGDVSAGFVDPEALLALVSFDQNTCEY